MQLLVSAFDENQLKKSIEDQIKNNLGKFNSYDYADFCRNLNKQ